MQNSRARDMEIGLTTTTWTECRHDLHAEAIPTEHVATIVSNVTEHVRRA